MNKVFWNVTYSSHTNHIVPLCNYIDDISHLPTPSFSLFIAPIGEVITYQKYRENLMRELLEEHHTPRRPPTGGRPAADNPLRLNARHFPSKVPQTAAQGSRTRRHCKVCLSSTRRRKQRKLTKYMCVPCDIPLCVAPCFGEYHTLKHYWAHLQQLLTDWIERWPAMIQWL